MQVQLFLQNKLFCHIVDIFRLGPFALTVTFVHGCHVLQAGKHAQWDKQSRL